MLAGEGFVVGDVCRYASNVGEVPASFISYLVSVNAVHECPDKCK